MKKLLVIFCMFLFCSLSTTKVFADDTKIKYSIPAKVTFVDGNKESTIDVYLEEKLTMPEINIPANSNFVGFYYTYNGIDLKWDFGNDVVTKDKLSDGLYLTLTASYEEIVIEEKETTKIIIVTKDKSNFLSAILNLDKDAIVLSKEEQGKDVRITLRVTELENSNSKEKEELMNRFNQSKQEIATFFEVVLEKTISNQTTQINELNKKAKITITIPDNIYNENYEYSVYRAHTNQDGSIAIDNIYNGKANGDQEITFESDKFSTFALTYKGNDTAKNDDKESVKKEKQEEAVEVDEYKLPLIIWICVGVSLAVAIVFMARFIKKK